MTDKPYQAGSAYSFSGGDPPPPSTSQQVFSFFSKSWSSLAEKVKNVVTEAENEAIKLKERLQEEKENVKRAILESTDAPDPPSPEATVKSKFAPWENLDPTIDSKVQEDIKNDILSISKSHRNLTNAPPETPGFVFSLSDQIDTAMAALEKDPNLSAARYALVPKVISENGFWQNYFYRIYLIKQAYNVPQEATSSSNAREAAQATSPPPDLAEDKLLPPVILDNSPPVSTTAVAKPTPIDTNTTASDSQASTPAISALPADSETIEFASEYYGLDDNAKTDLQHSLTQLGMTEDELVTEDTLVVDE